MLNIDDFRVLPQIPYTLILIHPILPQPEAIEANKPYLWSRSKCWMRAGKRTFNAPRLKSQIWLRVNFVALKYELCSLMN